MADIRFELGDAIELKPMIPTQPGVPTGLPPGLYGNTEAGVYLILNQYPNSPKTQPENRYLGVTSNFQDRFASRQGACFELGFLQQTLDGVYAYLGEMKYRNNGDPNWSSPAGYEGSDLKISLDNVTYDFEHIFIKAAQEIWQHGTVSNTLKTGPLTNDGNYPLNISISYLVGNNTFTGQTSLQPGEEIP